MTNIQNSPKCHDDEGDRIESPTQMSASMRRQRLIEKMRVLQTALNSMDEEDGAKTNKEDTQTVDLNESFDSIASRDITSAPSFPPRIGMAQAPVSWDPYVERGSRDIDNTMSLSFSDLVSSSSDINPNQEDIVGSAERRPSTDASRRAMRRKMQLLSGFDTVNETDATTSLRQDQDVKGVMVPKDTEGACLASRMSLVMPPSCFSSSESEGVPSSEEPQSSKKKLLQRLSFRSSAMADAGDGSVVGAISRDIAQETDPSNGIELMMPPLSEEEAGAQDDAESKSPSPTSSKYLRRMKLLNACNPLYHKHQTFSSVNSTSSSRDEVSTANEKDEVDGTSSSRHEKYRNIHLLAACNPLKQDADKASEKQQLSRTPLHDSVSSTTHDASMESEKQALPKCGSKRGLLRKIHVLTYCNPLREHPADLVGGESADMLDPVPYQKHNDGIQEPVDASEKQVSCPVDRTKTGPVDLDEFDNGYSNSLFSGFGDVPIELPSSQAAAPPGPIIPVSTTAENAVVDGVQTTPPRAKKVHGELSETNELQVIINMTTEASDTPSFGKSSSAPTSPSHTASISTVGVSGFPVEERNSGDVTPERRDSRSLAKVSSAPTSPGHTASVSTVDASGFPIEDSVDNGEGEVSITDECNNSYRSSSQASQEAAPATDGFFQPFMDFLLGPLDDEVHSLEEGESYDTSYAEEDSRTAESSAPSKPNEGGAKRTPSYVSNSLSDTDNDSVAVQVQVKEHIPRVINLQEERSKAKMGAGGTGPVPKSISALRVDRPVSPMLDTHNFDPLPCACGRQEECNGISAAFYMLSDERSGYIQVPEYRSQAETHFDIETNRLRDALLQPFMSSSEANDLVASGTQQYVANHHFHPGIISSQSSGGKTSGKRGGILPMYISENAMRSLKLDMSYQNHVVNDNGEPTGFYYVVPNYSVEQTKEDLKKSIKVRRVKLENSKHKKEIAMLKEYEDHSFSSTIAQTLKTNSGQAWYDRVY